MKYTVCFYFLLMLVSLLPAQHLERSVIGSTGTYIENDSIAISMTVGESVIAPFQSGTLILLQGFHKGGEGLSTSIEPEAVSVFYSFYPNPTSDQLFIQLEAERAVDLQIRLLDMQGKLADVPVQKHQRIQQLRTDLSLGNLPAGTYILQFLSEEQGPQQSFRIVKQ